MSIKQFKSVEDINLPEEFFYAIQEKMGGDLIYEYLSKPDKESFRLALQVILELTSVTDEELNDE